MRTGIKRYCFFCCALMACHAASQPPDSWITAGEYSEFHVLIPEKAPETVRYAAERFQAYWKMATGMDADISSSPEGRVNVRLGEETLSWDLRKHGELEYLRDEEAVIRSYAAEADPGRKSQSLQLVINARAPKGILNGVFLFFAYMLDFDWLAPGVICTTRARFTMPAFAHSYVSPFYVRELDTLDLLESCGFKPDDILEFRRAWGFPDRFLRQTPPAGTLSRFLPAAEFGESDPDWYVEQDSARVLKQALCYSDESLRKTIGLAVLDALAAWNAPQESGAAEPVSRENIFMDEACGIIDFSPPLNAAPCNCERCRAVAAQYGTPAAPFVLLLKEIAEKADDAWPRARYRLHARLDGRYRKAPAGLRLSDNVIVELTTAACNRGRPLDDPESPVNAAFLRDLDGWAETGAQLHVEYHAGHPSSPLLLCPDYHTVQQDFRLLDYHHVSGLSVESANEKNFFPAGFSLYRNYLLARLLWDPDHIVEFARERFFNEWYGPAGPHLLAALDLLITTAREKGFYLDGSTDLWWCAPELVSQVTALFDAAEAEMLSPEEARRLGRARLPFDQAAITGPPSARADGENLVLERAPALSLDAFRESLALYLPEKMNADAVLAEAGLSEGAVPPRRESFEMKRLSAGKSLVWVVPALGGAVVRWRYGREKNELFRYFKNPGARAGLWREYQADGAMISPSWDLKGCDGASVTLAGKLAPGLVLEKGLTLVKDEETLVYRLEVRNDGEKAADGAVLIRPDFFSPANRSAVFYIQKEGAWKPLRLQDADGPSGLWQSAALQPARREGYACYLPAPDVALYAMVEGDGDFELRPAVNRADAWQCARFEILFSPGLLKPGEARHISISLSPGKGVPGDTAPVSMEKNIPVENQLSQ
jgi:hypothetical protein